MKLEPPVWIGSSAVAQKLLATVDQVAETDATVLLLGETGTGKQVLAERIHAHSGRAGTSVRRRQLRRTFGGSGRQRSLRS